MVEQYKNYLVPKGTVVVLNTCMHAFTFSHLSRSSVLFYAADALFHDPDIFEDPELFNPDRFLNSEHGTRPGMDTDFRDNFLFGGGRVSPIYNF
jgi:hypothetical protein